MKLWQRIGLDNKSAPTLDELGEYSTIRVETKKECNQDDFDIFEQFINPTLAKRINEEELCHQIQSCESEVIDSGPPSLASPTRKQAKRFYLQDQKKNIENRSDEKKPPFLYDSQKQKPVNQSNKISKQRLHLQRTKSLKLEIIFLHEENNNLKKSAQFEFHKMKQEILTVTKQLQQKIAERYQNIISICSKCENQKKTIDALTKQCWGVEEKLKEKTTENANLQTKITILSAQSMNPLRKVEQGLLQERGELVKRLKQQLELLQEENLSCRQTIEDKDNYLEQLEGAYKSNLIELKQEIEFINEACSEKIEQILQQKEAVEQELLETQRRFENIQQEYDYLKRDQKMYLSMGQSPIIQKQEYFRRMAEEQKIKYSMVSNSTKNLRLVTVPHEEGIIRNYAKYPTCSMTQFASPQIYNKQSSLRSISRENSDRDSPRAAYLSKKNLRSKEKWIDLSFAKRRAEQNINSIQSCRGGYSGPSESNYEKALSSLEEIKKDVRRQIRRSKMAGK